MLDERTRLLLAQIDRLCGAGGYQITESRELCAAFPAQAQPDGGELRLLLEYLQTRGYIDVRYAEEGVYCICPLPDGRLYFEREREENARARRVRRGGLLVSALGGSLGGLVGGFLATLLSLLWAGI